MLLQLLPLALALATLSPPPVFFSQLGRSYRACSSIGSALLKAPFKRCAASKAPSAAGQRHKCTRARDARIQPALKRVIVASYHGVRCRGRESNCCAASRGRKGQGRATPGREGLKVCHAGSSAGICSNLKQRNPGAILIANSSSRPLGARLLQQITHVLRSARVWGMVQLVSSGAWA